MPNHNLIKRSLAAAAVVATAGFPTAAQAVLIGDGVAPAGPAPSARSVPQPVASSHSSFQWGDAGIGAAGAVALLGTGALGVSMTRRRRTVVG